MNKQKTVQQKDQECEERKYLLDGTTMFKPKIVLTKKKFEILSKLAHDHAAQTKWKYYTERGERKRRLKIATLTGPEAIALHNDTAEIVSSYHKGVFELFMEETLDV